MTKQIKLTRYRNIRLRRYEANAVLTIGDEVSLGQAQTLVRIGGAEWATPAKKNKAAKPVKETK